MWLSPASLELHQITWDDPASLLEKIVAYEVCISSFHYSNLSYSRWLKVLSNNALFIRRCILSATSWILKEDWE